MVLIHATTTFRLALLYLALFVGSVVVILLMAYRFTAGFMDEEFAASVGLEITALKERYEHAGIDGLAQAVGERATAPHSNGLYLLVGPNGRPAAGNIASWPPVPPDADGWLHFKVADSRRPDGRPVVAKASAYVFPERYRLLVGRDMSDLEELSRRMTESLGWIVLITGCLGLAGGGLLSRGALRRLETINRTALRIVAGDFSRRIPALGGGDEIDKLADTLNLMLDRIEDLMNGVRQVSESVAHDLRTPLARMRSRIELSLRDRDADADRYRAALEDTLEEADRLLATFAALLSIAEAESGAGREKFQPADLTAAAALAAELYEPVAEDLGVRLIVDAAPGAMVSGLAPLLSQAAANLLDNALKFTPPGGEVRLTVGRDEKTGGATLTVADSGPGIPENERDRALQRFVRLDQSRALPGNGLGLSLVAAVARLHGATLILTDAGGPKDAPGLAVALTFPPLTQSSYAVPLMK